MRICSSSTRKQVIAASHRRRALPTNSPSVELHSARRIPPDPTLYVSAESQPPAHLAPHNVADSLKRPQSHRARGLAITATGDEHHITRSLAPALKARMRLLQCVQFHRGGRTTTPEMGSADRLSRCEPPPSLTGDRAERMRECPHLSELPAEACATVVISMAEVPVRGEGIEWLIMVAHNAAEFFAPSRDPSIAASVGKPEVGSVPARLTIGDFIDYLSRITGKSEWGRAPRIMHVLEAMHASMMLVEDGFAGGSIFGRVYVTIERGTSSQANSHLYLSEVLGSALIIPTFGAITIPIPGINRKTGDADIGTGIVVSDKHILTNRHVVTDMEVAEEIPTPQMVPPRIDWSDMADAVRVVGTRPHEDEHLDVAIVEVEPIGSGGLNHLAGVAFREPVWGDQTYVFGYPPVPTSDDAYLAVQQGSVEDPGADGQTHRFFTTQHGEVVAPSVGTYVADTRYFYFSAVTRPGNSGGPIVAQDGRVIGLVAHRPYDSGRSDAPFYRGVPTPEIVRALRDIFKDEPIPITLEDWDEPLPGGHLD